MIINLIVAHMEDDCYSICSAWDEGDLDANYDGWEKERKKWAAKYSDIRVIEIEVPDDMYPKAFAPGDRIKGKVRENSEHQE